MLAVKAAGIWLAILGCAVLNGAFRDAVLLLSDKQALALGAFWLVLTLLFELGFGRIVQQRAWPELLEAYTLRDATSGRSCSS